ncbi:MAG TPA: hypothetical protein VJM34_03080 [Novosphingobium sp.]|nr:hypothetical protein [Novosphingobium sp.]
MSEGQLKSKRLIAIVVLLVAFFDVATASAQTSRVKATAPIPLPNVEDMVVLPGGHWLIASSMSSDDVEAGLYIVETATARFEQAYPSKPVAKVGLPPKVAQSNVTDPCATELAPAEFSGHGISYQSKTSKHGELYVVNHGARESIEIFDVQLRRTGTAAPTLTWKGCIFAPHGTVGNAVVSTQNGRVYATVTPVVDGLPRTGNIRYWTPSDGWTALPGSEVNVPTGLMASRDGQKLYVSSFVDRKVIELSLGGNPARREVAVKFGADNLSVANDGALLVGGLEGNPADIMRLCRTSDGPHCTFTGYLARLDPKSLVVTCTLELGPTVTTTAAQVGPLVWLGSSRAPKIWRTRAAALKTCPGRVDVGAGARRPEPR